MTAAVAATVRPRDKGARLLPYVAVSFAACSWGTWAYWLRLAETRAPLPAAFESAVVMASIAAGSAIPMLRDRLPRRASTRARAWVVWLGVSDALNVLLFFAAYKITIAVSVLAHYLTPALVALASPIVLRERLSARTVVAVTVSVAGLAVMIGGRSGTAGSAAVWTSAALGAGSAVFYASNVIANKFVIDEFSTSEAMCWHGVAAALFIVLFVPWHAWATIDWSAAGVLALAALWPGAIAGLAFVWGLRRMPAAHASTLTLLEPLVAVFLGAAVFGEVLGARSLLGGAMILAGSLLVVTQSRGGARPSVASLDR